MPYASLLVKIEAHVRNLFAIHMHPYLVYHNLSHTENVVRYTARLSEYYDLKPHSHFIIMAAAWFHDTGHLFGEIEGHEALSATLMEKYLGDTISKIYLNHIRQCIMATKMPVHPGNLLEMIICDADTWHLGTTDFFGEDHKVWQEVEARKGKIFDNKPALSLRFMEQHIFFTSYCIQHLSEGKRENVKRLNESIGG
ncbi:HD domain-containing protein [Chitinophaga sp. LS1]|uniref:HD domain-containing protein n=1 Tax=Chitinophaga sp. LS1 TaxID=3051176 RepID=UPI002AAB8EEA|nr:HD domain-containing protein [Chitinophaga sp. LS1]WPV64633.1 HD domain-containing protein [Chitinophaga sp. LS1]